mgnify:CR=1 FL=1
MDFLEVIEKRHSVRKYSDKPVERELLDAIVKVAQTAPSSRNSKSFWASSTARLRKWSPLIRLLLHTDVRIRR